MSRQDWLHHAVLALTEATTAAVTGTTTAAHNGTTISPAAPANDEHWCRDALAPSGDPTNTIYTWPIAYVGDSPAISFSIIVVCSVIGLVFAAWHAASLLKIPIATFGMDGSSINASLVSDDGEIDTSVNKKVVEISDAIARGAKAFLMAEYKYLSIFLVVFGIFTFIAIGSTMQPDASDIAQSLHPWTAGALSGVAFLVGGTTSIVSGYIGMTIAVQANSRTALQAQRGYVPAFRTAFRAGAVLGFALCGLALLMLFVLIQLFSLQFPLGESKTDGMPSFNMRYLFETIASYGFGGSAVALFGRVGGGIYTKAADVGADLVGKVEQGIPEDDPRNPAVIADNVGDNVGDVAGMGADLFGSFAEASCAALVIASDSQSGQLVNNWNSILLPLVISASGIIACLFTSFLASHIGSVVRAQDIEPALKRQLFVSTLLETPLLVLICMGFLPAQFCIGAKNVHNWGAAICAVSGLWAGLIIGYITEYYTSHSYRPVREVAGACKTGAATNIIYGLALGYNSAIIPVLAIAGSIFISYELASLYGIALAALGILSTLSIGLTIDVYGPVSDNAGGIAEMAGIGEHVRERTDALDAAGNTTAAIGKGFAIGSAAFVSLALFGAYVTRVKASFHEVPAPVYSGTTGTGTGTGTTHLTTTAPATTAGATNWTAAGPAPVFTVDILQPFQFCGLLIGAMLPYAFSALTMKSVGKAALAMVEEVRRQFLEIPGIMEGTGQPDYERCVKISTESSLREMLLPGLLVLGSPIVVGFIMGPAALAGLLAGSLVSGVQMAISSSNTGGAWDNAKKYIEQGAHGGKGSEPHKAAVIGDTVGDPLKDTSGPALNILMKLQAVESLVLAPFFIKYNLCELTTDDYDNAWCSPTNAI